MCWSNLKGAKMKTIISFFVIGLSLTVYAKPKYGPEAILLSKSHEYIQEQKAPDYWALSPYYLPQENGKSCSVASVAIVMNAARIGLPLTADDQLVTHEGVLKKTNDKKWINAVTMNRPGGGVALDELKNIVEESLRAYGFKNFTVTATHMENSKEAKDELHKILLENEKSARDFIIANFVQGVFTGDSDIGHISPVGGYDQKRKRVLIMDVDREWYEPYWVSEETFAAGMATKDKPSNLTRGYIYIKLDNR